MCSSLWFPRVSDYLGDIGSREINSLRFYPQHLLHFSARTTVPPAEISKLHEPVVESLVSSWRAPTVHEIWSSQPLNLSVKAACSVTFVVTLQRTKMSPTSRMCFTPQSFESCRQKQIDRCQYSGSKRINPKVLIKHLWMCHRSSAAISQKLRGNCFIDKKWFSVWWWEILLIILNMLHIYNWSCND